MPNERENMGNDVKLLMKTFDLTVINEEELVSTMELLCTEYSKCRAGISNQTDNVYKCIIRVADEIKQRKPAFYKNQIVKNSRWKNIHTDGISQVKDFISNVSNDVLIDNEGNDDGAHYVPLDIFIANWEILEQDAAQTQHG